MKIINFFGGPGVGKSTIAAELFVTLKKKQLEVELVTEYAKDLVYEERYNVLEDQIYILAKQNRRLLRLLHTGIDFVITDSPILMGVEYYRQNGGTSSNFISLAKEVFDSYDNLNFLLRRNSELEYKGVGRLQKSVEEAREIDTEIHDLLKEFKIPYRWCVVNKHDQDELIQKVVEVVLGEEGELTKKC